MPAPSHVQISAWKAQYGNVFSTEVANQHCVFRSLTFKELYQLTSNKSGSVIDLEDFVVQHGLLYPDLETIELLPAGAYLSLVDEIKDASGLGNAKRAIETLDKARNEAQNIVNIAKVYILTTMPAYKEEDLDNLTATQLFHKIALAEGIIQLQQQIATGNELIFTIIDPEEEAAKEAEAERKAKERHDRFMAQKGYTDKNAPPPIKPKLRTDDPILAKLRGRR